MECRHRSTSQTVYPLCSYVTGWHGVDSARIETSGTRKIKSARPNFENFPATTLLAFFTKDALDPTIGNEPHHGDHHVNYYRYPGTNKGQQYRHSIKYRGNFALFIRSSPCPLYPQNRT